MKFLPIIIPLIIAIPLYAEDEIEFVDESEVSGLSELDFIFSAKLSTRNAVDTSFNGQSEDLFESLNSLNISVRGEIVKEIDFFIEGRFLYWAAINGNENNSALPFNRNRFSAEFEPELLETYLIYRSPQVSLLGGNQIVGWGGTTFVNPVNQINPLDYRYGILTDEKLPYLPTFAVRVIKPFYFVEVELLFVPFFFPSRYSVAGRDYSIFRGANGVITMPPIFYHALGLIDQTVSDKIQPYMLATELPDETLKNFSGGARVMFNFEDFKFGFSYFYGFDRTPHGVFNKEMALVLGKVFETGLDLNALFSLITDPEEAEFRRAYQKIIDEKVSIDEVYKSSYRRMHSIGFEGSARFGDFHLNLEAAFQPERTFYYSDLTPFRKPCLSSAASLEYNYRTELDATLEIAYLRLFGIEKDMDLLLIENDMITLFGALHYRFLEYERAQLGITFMYGASREDYFISPSAKYKFTNAFHLTVGAEIIGGKKGSPGGMFTNNDQMYIKGDLFF